MPGIYTPTKESNEKNVFVSRTDNQVAYAVDVGASDTNPLPVEVVSGGSGSGSVNIPATIIKDYITHDLDEASTPVSYIGKLSNSGNWLIVKMDETSELDLTYANVSNNSSYTTYTAAYAARASLTYQDLDQLSFAGSGTIPISSSKIMGESLVTGEFEHLNTINGALKIIESSTETKPIDNYLLRVIDAPKLMTSDTVVDAYTINMVAGHGFSVGDELLLVQNGNDVKSFGCKILSIATNTLTIDSPFDSVYESAEAVVLKVSKELNIDGSVTPVIFDLPNSTTTEFHITRIIIHLTDANAMDDAKFGSLTSLTRGIVFRKKNSDGTYNNIFNVKNNGEFGELAYDLTYQDAVKHGTYGLHCRLTYSGLSKHGTCIKIKQNEAIEVLVQDDLTSLDSFRIMAQGHFGLPPLE